MKSYLRFLSRNKLYTAIEVVGLSLALAFLIVLGSVLIEKSQVNDDIKDKDRIYSLVTTGGGSMIGHYGEVGSFLPQIPLVEEWCRFHPGRQVKVSTEKGDSLIVSPMEVTSNFFDFFGIGLVHGDAQQALKINGKEAPMKAAGMESFIASGPRETAPLEQKGNVVLSKHLAEAFFPDEHPIGKSISLLDIHTQEVRHRNSRAQARTSLKSYIQSHKQQ